MRLRPRARPRNGLREAQLPRSEALAPGDGFPDDLESMPATTLRELVRLSRELGRPDRTCSIVGEGNASARIDDRSMWIKASGASLRDASIEQFVRVDCQRALALLDAKVTTFRHVHLGLEDAKVDHEVPHHPSRETLLHAVCMQHTPAAFVARTHPTEIDALACSNGFYELASMRLTPDHVAVCGRAPLLVGYATPGVALASALRDLLRGFQDEHGTHPRVVLLQNNGMLTLGETPSKTLAVTLMAIEIARVLAATRAFGGPRGLSAEELDELTSADDPFDGPTIQEL